MIAEADNFTTDGHFAHALVIINGNCAQYASDLPILQYRLARQLGRVLGLDWSQINDNVVTGAPPPTMNDYAGYPMMHPMGALCFPTYGCTSNPLQTRMDDQAAISRLYPVTAANIGSFSGKTLFFENTARIEGSVRFPAWNGNLGQGMQGVNVVARMIDPVTGLASHKYTASCVSGFLFRGDAGNPITGYTDNSGEPLDRFGSNNTAVEGYFDLAGLQFPAGYNTVQYQLSAESVNSLYIDGLSVGPYKEGSIPMSGTFTPITVTVSKGSDVSQDLVMKSAPSQPQDQWEPSTFTQFAEIPGGGDWIGSLSGYGDIDFYHLHARANRTFSFSVTALNENGSPTVTKAQPAIGIWQSTDSLLTPSLSQSAFGTMQTGVTQLVADVNLEDDYKLGIADTRGDGRPDFSYEARVLYGDTISPARASVHTNTPITITGFGFSPTTTVMVGTNSATVLSQQAGQIVISAPALSDSTQTIYLQDSATGLTAEMDNVLNYGTINGLLTLLLGSNPQVPVGTQAPNPVRVRVTGSGRSHADPRRRSDLRRASWSRVPRLREFQLHAVHRRHWRSRRLHARDRRWDFHHHGIDQHWSLRTGCCNWHRLRPGHQPAGRPGMGSFELLGSDSALRGCRRQRPAAAGKDRQFPGAVRNRNTRRREFGYRQHRNSAHAS